MAPNAHRHPTAWCWSLGSLAVGITLLLAGCGGSHSSAADGGAAKQSTKTPSASRQPAPPDNGISEKPTEEIIVASDAALRSARSVRIRLAGTDGGSKVRMDFKITRQRDVAGWFEQDGLRIDVILVDGQPYMRSRQLWEKEADAATARLIGDRWVKPPKGEAEKWLPATAFSIKGFADMIFNRKDMPTFLAKSKTTLGNQSVIRLQAPDGSFYIAATSKPYPLRLDPEGEVGDNIVLSNYDQDFNIKVPADALDFSAVKG